MDVPEIPNSPWGTSPYQAAVAEGVKNVWLRWVLVGLGAVVLIGGGLGVYVYLNRPLALPISISYEAEPLIPGSMTDMTVTIHNGSVDQAAESVVAEVTLPDKTTASGKDNETASSTPGAPSLDMGTLGPGESTTTHLILSTALDPSSAAQVSARVTYKTVKSRTKEWKFEAETSGELVVREPAMSLAIEAPKAVVRVAPFNVTLRYRNNTDKPLAGAKLNLSLPRGITIVSSTPTLGTSTLVLPTMAPKQGGSFSLTLIPSPTAPHEIPIRATIDGGTNALAEQNATVLISSDALAITAKVQGSAEISIDLDQALEYEITVRNLATVPLRDIQVKAKLASQYFVLSSVLAEKGSLSASEPLVTWTGVGVPQLRSLEPGGKVSLRLNVRIAKTAGTATNIVAPLQLSAASPTVPAGTSATGVTASETVNVKIAAATAFTAVAYHSDPLGQIINTGPQPPKVGIPTQYTVRWAINPTLAGLKDAVVTATLEPGIRFTGKLGGVTSRDLSYDPNTGAVTWRPGVIAANGTAKAAFQIEITPSQNQVSRVPRLVGASSLVATDAFTSRAVHIMTPVLATNIGEGKQQSSGVVEQP